MSAMKEELLTIVEAIDWVFGEGYAKKNPELMGRMLVSNAVSYASYQISEAIRPSEDEEDEEEEEEEELSM